MTKWEPEFREWLKGQGVGRTAQNQYYHAAKATIPKGITNEDDVNWIFKEKSESYRKDLRRGIRRYQDYQKKCGGAASAISSTVPDGSTSGGRVCTR